MITLAIEMYKIIDDKSPSYVAELVKVKQITYNLRTPWNLNVPDGNTTERGLQEFMVQQEDCVNSLCSADLSVQNSHT